MPVHCGVRVTLKRFEDDKPYREYRRTQQSSTGSRIKKEVYVAAVSGERFYVLVDLTGLHSRSAPDVKVSFRIDAGGKKNHYFSAKDKGPKLSLKYKDTERFIDGEWKSCASTFRDTEIGVFLLSFYPGGGNMLTSCRRSAEPTELRVDQDVDTYRRLSIEITRGTRTMFDEPEMLLPTQNKEGTVFSKEAVKHNCLSQATQYVNTEQFAYGNKIDKSYMKLDRFLNRLFDTALAFNIDLTDLQKFRSIEKLFVIVVQQGSLNP